jgi:hypothetical protein
MLVTGRNIHYIGPSFKIAPTKEEAPIMFWGTIINVTILVCIIIYDYTFGLW